SAFRRICDQHGRVESLRVARSDPGRLAAELRQTTLALGHEAEERERIELQQARLRERERIARVRAENLTQHLAQLQRLTSSLSEAIRVVDVAAVPLAEVSISLHAEVELGVATGRPDELLVFRADAPPARVLVDEDGELPPLAHAFRSGQP